MKTKTNPPTSLKNHTSNKGEKGKNIINKENKSKLTKKNPQNPTKTRPHNLPFWTKVFDMQVPAKFLNLLFKYIWHVLMTEQGGFMSLGVEFINYTYIWSLNKFKLIICFQNYILQMKNYSILHDSFKFIKKR